MWGDKTQNGVLWVAPGSAQGLLWALLSDHFWWAQVTLGVPTMEGTWVSCVKASALPMFYGSGPIGVSLGLLMPAAMMPL